MSNAEYPEDEFDQLGREMPRGAHRPSQPWWHGVLPFVIAIIAAPLLAWALFLLIGSHKTTSEASQDPAATPTASQSSPSADTSEGMQSDAATRDSSPVDQNSDTASSQRPDDSEADEADESHSGSHLVSSPSPSRSTTADATGNAKSVTVSVQNASGISGLAAKAKGKLDDAGFTKVEAGNHTGTKPRQNTIYFKPGHEEEAKEVQKALQIDMVVDSNNLSADVVVVLVKAVR